MLDVRTCRVCGCWESAACSIVDTSDGCCAWVAADRCSACPADAAKTLPINAHHVRAVTLDAVARADLPDSMVSETFRAVEFPRLVVTMVTRPGGPPVVTAFVGALTVVDPNDAGAIADLLNLPEAA